MEKQKNLTKDNIISTIEDILIATINSLKYAYEHNKEACQNKNCKRNEYFTRIVFPTRRIESKNGKTRISEQELRFAFVEQFNKYCDNQNLDYYYSIETPTNDTYSGFADHNPQIDPKGRSGAFDMVIHDNSLNRICLIEFKEGLNGHNEYDKDFLKLSNLNEGNDNVPRFFIEILREVDEEKMKSLKSKFTENTFNKNNITITKCVNLTDGTLVNL